MQEWTGRRSNRPNNEGQGGRGIALLKVNRKADWAEKVGQFWFGEDTHTKRLGLRACYVVDVGVSRQLLSQIVGQLSLATRNYCKGTSERRDFDARDSTICARFS